MATFEPGSPVRVIIEGSYAKRGSGGFTWGSITSSTGCEWEFDHDEPNVVVVPVAPERPTLEQVLLAHFTRTSFLNEVYCACGFEGDPTEHLASVLRDAFPELPR